MGLITEDYAQAALSELNLTDDQLDHLDDVIEAASTAVERWCYGRRFAKADYDRVLAVGWDGSIMLPDLPVHRVDRVAVNRTAALRIKNTSTANQRATVGFAFAEDAEPWKDEAPTGLKLTRVASGASSSATITFADEPTLADLAAAIDALGNGWSAEVLGDFGAWASTELVDSGAAGGATGAGVTFDVFAEDLTPSAIRLDRAAGLIWITRSEPGVGRGDRFGLEDLDAWPILSPEPMARVVYPAGFATIPPDVQAATADTVKRIFEAYATDSYLAGEQGPHFSYQIRRGANIGVQISEPAQRLLAPYRLVHA